MSTVGSTGTSVLAGGSVDDSGAALVIAGGDVITAASEPAGAAVSGGGSSSVVVACVPDELEHDANNTGAASHSERALARLMIGNSTGSAADALVIERGASPVVAIEDVAG
ncbi:MAG TPA: hypothetical protein VIK05_10970, partial [Ilumatobacteraceae bacterium]